MRGFLIATTLLSTSCFLSSEALYCASTSDGETEACIDIYDIDNGLFTGVGLRASLAILCGVVGAEPVDGQCPDEGKIAGCQGDEQDAYLYTEWTYDDGSGLTADDVSCAGSDTKVGPDGTPL